MSIETFSIPAHADGAVLTAAFTPTPIVVDGHPTGVWNDAPAEPVAICMKPDLSGPATGCPVSGTVQALWHGPTLYLLFTVTDPDVTTDSDNDTNRSGVTVFVDQFDDKFPKFEEDDGQVTISADGRQTGNRTNAGLRYYPTIWSTHLLGYAAAPRVDTQNKPVGYCVEVAWQIGDRPLRNGTKIGMEFSINAVSSATGERQYRLFWSSGNNHGLDDNTRWGSVVLGGYDRKFPMPLNSFLLLQNVKKGTPAPDSASGLVRGIWADETDVDEALVKANATLAAPKSQREIDRANADLAKALDGLRRTGKYPDPHDLPEVAHLPNPFRFFSGATVKTAADWARRRDEIKEMAQYYEFGTMPAAPESLTATSTGTGSSRTIQVTIADKGKTASFSPTLYLPTTGQAPYPVIVELDFSSTGRFARPNPAFIKGGYAVLSIPTSDSTAFGLRGIASDDGNHTGAFYTLYPYRLDAEGNDRGVLLAWAWGGRRGVDALQYLAAHDPSYAGLLDLKKLVVTGFSRWGKAALLAGMLDDRFLVTAPGGSGSGGAAPYRYDSFGNVPFRHAPFGNVYPWGTSPGAESMVDHLRHQTHNSNEMFRRFLNEPRMYQTQSWGYGTRLPYDHHEEIAAIAPRAVLIINTNDDYADNAEGDSIGYEGAKPVYAFLGASQNLALDIFMGGGGHSLKPSQAQDIVDFSNFVLFGKALPADTAKHLSTDPFLDAGTYNRYYGGLETMMPWSRRTR